jgi:hypothetical protein
VAGAGPEGSAPPESAEPAAGGPESGEGGSESGEGGSESGEDRADRPRRRRRRRRRKPGEEGAVGAETEAEAGPAPGAGGEAAPAVAREPREPGEPGPGARKREKRRKRRERGESRPERAERPSGGPPAGRRPEHLGTVAVKALAEMARALLDAEGVDPFARPRWLDLQLRVPLDPDRDAVRAAGEAVRQLVARVEDVRRHESALRPGSVYCYFSNSAEAPHSRPQQPREVFDGFSSTGRPVFTDFVTLAIERRDAGIDDLVNGEDVVVTHVSMGRVLRTQQLQEFGAESPVYRILGQVDAGLYPMLGSDQKAAFSFQLLRGTTLDGMPRFRLHWVGAADVRDIADPAVGSILKRFQLMLDRETLRFAGLGKNGAAPDEEEFVLPLLQELGKRLAGRARRAGRRTEHATQRADERVRPTAKAFGDAKEAGDDRILRDDEQGTIVVVGPKNRVHVFGTDGRHVTSFVMTGGQVQKRRSEGRWHPAEPEERGEFRLALRRRLKAGEASAEDSAADPET